MQSWAQLQPLDYVCRYTVVMQVDASIALNARGDVFCRKRSEAEANAPCQNENAKTPQPHSSKRPPYRSLDKRPGAELGNHLSVGGGTVSEACKGVLFIGRLMPGMRVASCFAPQQLNRQSQTRTENEPCFRRLGCKE